MSTEALPTANRGGPAGTSSQDNNSGQTSKSAGRGAGSLKKKAAGGPPAVGSAVKLRPSAGKGDGTASDSQGGKVAGAPGRAEAARSPLGGSRGSKEQVERSPLSSLREGQIRKGLKRKIAEFTAKTEEAERLVGEVVRVREGRRGKTLRLSLPRENPLGVKLPQGFRKQIEADRGRNETARAKRVTELMRICLNIVKQLMQHKWGWPFNQPVDVEGLGLHDYHKIVKTPMDLGTIKQRLEAGGPEFYRQPSDVAADVRLVFSNAMLYNAEGTDVHVMAKTLNERFTEKWQSQLEQKAGEEAVKRKQEEADFRAREAAAFHAAEEVQAERIAAEVDRQLELIERQLAEMKELAVANCRQMTVEEKRHLGGSLGRLPSEKLARVVQIVAQANPTINQNDEDVEVDLDKLEPATLWRLYRYVQRCDMERMTKSQPGGGSKQQLHAGPS